jgi:hypothetical protein
MLMTLRPSATVSPSRQRMLERKRVASLAKLPALRRCIPSFHGTITVVVFIFD